MSDLLKANLKNLICETLDLEDVSPEDLQDDAPLMNSDLGIDSIDALELVVQVEKQFGIKIENSEEARKALASVASLAEFIESKQS